MGMPAVFWDRDNTLIADPGYLSDPDAVQPLPGAFEAVRRLAEAGFENVIVTNQSGVARGLVDESTLEQIHDRLVARFAEAGAQIHAIYYCPYLDGDEAVVEQYRRPSDLRKPLPGMLLKASLERKINLAASWSIGDSLRDAQAGRAAGCRTILLVRDGATDTSERKHSAVDFVAESLEQAAEIVLKHTRTAGAGGSTAASSAMPPDVAGTLQEILTFLRMVDRRAQADDFSLTHLVGTIVQMIAIGVLLWAVLGWFLASDGVIGSYMMRLLLAIFLQLLALTLFLVSSRGRP